MLLQSACRNIVTRLIGDLVRAGKGAPERVAFALGQLSTAQERCIADFASCTAGPSVAPVAENTGGGLSKGLNAEESQGRT